MQATLVAQNADERDILSFVLKHSGLSVTLSASLGTVSSKWLEQPSDLVLVAWQHKAELLVELATLRTLTQVPILLLTDPPTEEQLCNLLHAGADLVLSRPVSPRVLSEYARVLLRRNQTIPSFVLPALTFSEIELDPDTRAVKVASQAPKRLTQLEFRLLYVLMVNRGQVIPVDVIVERVWGYTDSGNRELVRGLVSRLRRKIEPDPGNPRFVQNVPGVGYRFSMDEI